MAIDRAMHNRCCWPPDMPYALSSNRSLTSSHSAARVRASSTMSSRSLFFFVPSTRGPKAMFSKIDLGNGLGAWNTIPMRLRTSTASTDGS